MHRVPHNHLFSLTVLAKNMGHPVYGLKMRKIKVPLFKEQVGLYLIYYLIIVSRVRNQTSSEVRWTYRCIAYILYDPADVLSISQ